MDKKAILVVDKIDLHQTRTVVAMFCDQSHLLLMIESIIIVKNGMLWKEYSQ